MLADLFSGVGRVANCAQIFDEGLIHLNDMTTLQGLEMSDLESEIIPVLL